MVFHQVGLSSTWSFNRVISPQGSVHQGGLSSGWSFIRVVSRQVGFPSGWCLVRAAFRQDGLSSRCSLISLVSRQGSLSSRWSLVKAASRQGGLSSGRSLIRVALVKVVSRQDGLSSGRSLVRAVSQLRWYLVMVVSRQGGLSSMRPIMTGSTVSAPSSTCSTLAGHRAARHSPAHLWPPSDMPRVAWFHSVEWSAETRCRTATWHCGGLYPQSRYYGNRKPSEQPWTQEVLMSSLKGADASLLSVRGLTVFRVMLPYKINENRWMNEMITYSKKNRPLERARARARARVCVCVCVCD